MEANANLFRRPLNLGMAPEEDDGPKARLDCQAKELGCCEQEIRHGQ